jgi:hypothetical protein
MCEEIGLLGAQHVANVFDKAIIVNQLEELYRNLVEGNKFEK